MFASFHSKGTTPSFNDKLNTLTSGILICSTGSISSLGGILSTPGDLLSFIVFIFLATISGVTMNCPERSNLDIYIYNIYINWKLTALNSPIYIYYDYIYLIYCQ